MKNWLIKRLTPTKLKEERWNSLASALEQLWASSFDDGLSRLERLKSFYQADDADLARKLREMGDYFTYDLPKIEGRPISVAWRRQELEYKDLELILYSTFRRHFGTLPVGWLPIFAPTDEEYGSIFLPYSGQVTDKDKNIPIENTFLTSRGMLGVDLGELMPMGFNKTEFLERAVPLLKRTKPLHIVYGGPLFYIYFPLPFESEFDCTYNIDSPFTLQFSVLGARFDFTQGDKYPLDNTLMLTQEIERQCPLSFLDIQHTGRLDRSFLEGMVPEGWIPLDVVFSYNESEVWSPFDVFFTQKESTFPLRTEWKINHSICVQNTIDLAFDMALKASCTTLIECTKKLNPAQFQTGVYLDQIPCFDEISCDFMPLDFSHKEAHGGVYVQ